MVKYPSGFQPYRELSGQKSILYTFNTVQMIGQIRSGHHAVIKIGDGGKKGDHTDSKQDLTSLLISAFYRLPTLPVVSFSCPE